MDTTTGSILYKEKIVSLSQIQRNPARALDGAIVRIVKNGREIGIFFSKEEYEDLMEEQMELKPEFRKKLRDSIKKARKGKTKSLKEIL